MSKREEKRGRKEDTEFDFDVVSILLKNNK